MVSTWHGSFIIGRAMDSAIGRAAVRVRADAALALARDIFIAHGACEQNAAAVAEHLVGNDCLGISSHGLHRVVQYTDDIRSGLLCPAAMPTVRTIAPTRLQVEGGGTFGVVGAMAGVDAAADLGRSLWHRVRDRPGHPSHGPAGGLHGAVGSCGQPGFGLRQRAAAPAPRSAVRRLRGAPVHQPDGLGGADITTTARGGLLDNLDVERAPFGSGSTLSWRFLLMFFATRRVACRRILRISTPIRPASCSRSAGSTTATRVSLWGCLPMWRRRSCPVTTLTTRTDGATTCRFWLFGATLCWPSAPMGWSGTCARLLLATLATPFAFRGKSSRTPSATRPRSS